MLPWTGGIEGSENGLFIFALVAAALYLVHGAQGDGVKWAALKTLPLAFYALIAWRLNAPWLLCAGLALSALGDWCLAFKGEKLFLAGLSAFFVAHAAYIALFFLHSEALKLSAEPWRLAICAALIFHAVWMGGKLANTVPDRLKIPVFAYIAVISLMGLTAAACSSLVILSGALLFALSDTLLATSKFLIVETDARQSGLKAGLWITYIAAQTLILLGFTA